MFNILTLNKIAKCGLDQLNDNYKITDDANVDADGIILRSFKMHDMELPESLKAVARAGAEQTIFRLTSAAKRVSLFSTLRCKRKRC